MHQKNIGLIVRQIHQFLVEPIHMVSKQ